MTDSDHCRQLASPNEPSLTTAGSGGRLGWRNRVPARRRPALYFETLYNIGSGAFVALFLLSSVILKTVLDGTGADLARLAMLFGGSSLLSPVVSYLGRWFPMRSLVVYPNLAVAALLLLVAWPNTSATWFATVVGLTFFLRVFPRVAEMNLFRINYPPTHRGAAVGWVKAVAAVSGLTVTLLGYALLATRPWQYWTLYCLVAVVLVAATLCYARIPIPRQTVFSTAGRLSPTTALRQGLRVFITDRRFLVFQFGFALAGTANHMAIVFVPEVLKEIVGASAVAIGLIGAVLPSLLMTASAPFWGRYLDRVNPMVGRSVFNVLQTVAFAFHAYGGVTRQVWPFVIGAIVHAVANGGGTINWLTGSLYFARPDQIGLYNAWHVGLTGIRGLLAPALGLYLFRQLGFGAHLFTVASILSALGAIAMYRQGRADPGSREESVTSLVTSPPREPQRRTA